MKVYNKARGDAPADAVYVGRPTCYGNPFVIGTHGNREEVVRKFELYLLNNEELIGKIRKELKGKSLICWCAPRACHADILMKYANEP